MKATEANLLTFLRKSSQLTIPIYQRTYSWTQRECQQLWDDIVRTGENEAIESHFVGAIVYIEERLNQVANPSPLVVIDGQQRLTTVMMIIEALARRLGSTEPEEGLSAEKLRQYYLLNQLEKGDRRFKLLLTQTDKDTLLALVGQRQLPSDQSLLISQNFEFLDGCVRGLASTKVAAFWRGLGKLTIVDIALSREQDSPQLIFESMNSTGRELSQADLIRNYVLMDQLPHRQEELYEYYWRPMELEFGQEAYITQFDGFMRHYLTFKTGEIPHVRRVYETFKTYASTREIMDLGIDKMVADLRTFAGWYCAMALGKEPDNDLAQAFRDLADLKVDVAYPFLLELYQDYASKRLAKAEFLQVIRLVEAYVFRRAVCSIPTNSLNKTFSTLGRTLKDRKDRYLEAIQAYFLTLPSYRRFPDDAEFKGHLCHRDLYNFRSRSYWLRRMENHNRKEAVPIDQYTIEHILPRNENLRREWKEALGPDWKSV